MILLLMLPPQPILPSRVTLGTGDEYEYKATKRGLVRRSESELFKWLSVRYDEKRREY